MQLDPDTLETLCIIMHEAYEDAAKESGWETNLASRVEWEDVPQANKIAMYHAVSTLWDHIDSLFGIKPMTTKMTNL